MGSRAQNPDTILVPLDRILPNPWQTRERIDEAHVAELAADIKARGLLQPPLARLVDAAGVRVKVPVLPNDTYKLIRDANLHAQLAFGHSRIAALRLLAQEDPEEYNQVPLRLATLDDQDMALAAWSENAQRRDLTAIESARALARLRADFGWTQEQIAEHVGMARSTVANKLRLLEHLPEDLQARVQEGTVSERQAMALMPVLELPTQAWAALQEKNNDWRVREFQEALQHPEAIPSDQLRRRVDAAVDWATRLLAKIGQAEEFPQDLAFSTEAGPRPACLECEYRVQHGDEVRCAEPTCWEAKRKAYAAIAAEKLAGETGLPALSRQYVNSLSYNLHGEFYSYNGGPAGLELALSQHCPNLHVMDYGDKRDSPARVPGHPRAAYVCVRTKGPCMCMSKAARIANQTKRAQEKADRAGATVLRDEVIEDVAAALAKGDMVSWRLLLWKLLRYGPNEKRIATCDDMATAQQLVAEAVVDDIANWNYHPVGHLQSTLAEWRKTVGLPEMVVLPAEEPAPVRVEAETPADDSVEPPIGLEEQVAERLERLSCWLSDDGLDHLPDPLPAIRGNMANLRKLEERLETERPRPWDEHIQALALRIERDMAMLQVLEQAASIPDISAFEYPPLPAADEHGACGPACLHFAIVDGPYCDVHQCETTIGVDCADYVGDGVPEMEEEYEYEPVDD